MLLILQNMVSSRMRWKMFCFGKVFIQRGKSHCPNPVYYVLGQTSAGRYLLCLVI